MPYSGPSDSSLPDYVRKLSKSKRTQWVSIWTNAKAKGKSESEAFQLANGVVMGKKASEIVDGKSKEACEKDMAEMGDEEYKEPPVDPEDDDNDESDEPDDDEDDAPADKGDKEKDALPAFLQKKKASQPTADEVHTKVPIGKKKGPGAAFFKHLASQMKGRYSEEEYGEFVKAARAHAGGKGKAAAKAALMTSEIADICSYSDDSAYCLFNETNFAEPPDWVTFLPKPGTYSHPEYGKITITKARNQNFVTNFKNKVYQEKLPIDIEHKLSLSGAVAWVRDMRMAEDGTAQAKLEWNDRGKSLIEGDRFKYFSPAWYDNWEDPATNKVHHDVAIGGAITTRPFFKDANLQPLVASERGLFFQEGKAENDQQVFYFTAFAPIADPAQPDNSKGVIMPEDNKKEGAEVVPVDPVQFSELQKNFAEQQKAFAEQIKTLTEANEAKDKDVKTLSEKIAAQETAARTMRFTEEVKGKADGGIQWVGKDTDHIEFLESLADKFGEDSKEVKMYITQQRGHSTQLREAGLFKEVGSAATGQPLNATEQLNAKAAELITANPKLSKEQAFTEALNANPKLYEAYERGV